MGSVEPRSYRILDVLGRGGFGTVYRAQPLAEGDDAPIVALKVLNPEVASHTAALARLRHEAKMLGRLDHPAIVKLEGLIRLSGRWSIVMEYVPGASVKEVQKRTGPLPLDVALWLVAGVAEALDAAYTDMRGGSPLRMLHRDVKPGNIQVTAAGQVKLLDFGVARAERDSRERLGPLIGSVPYLAPERLRLEDSHSSDVFSLGASLLDVLGSRLQGEPTQDEEAHDARVQAAMGVLGDTVTDPVRQLMNEMLGFRPGQRPTAQEVVWRCRALVGEGTLAAWAGPVVDDIVATRPRVEAELTGEELTEYLAGQSVDELGTLSELLDIAADSGEAAPATLDMVFADAPPGLDDPGPAAASAPEAHAGGGRGPLVAVAAGALVLVAGGACVAVAIAVVAGIAVWLTVGA